MKRILGPLGVFLVALTGVVHPVLAADQIATGKVGLIAVNSAGWVAFHLEHLPALCNTGAGGETHWVQLTTNYMSLAQISQVLATLTAAKQMSREVQVFGIDNSANTEWSCRLDQIVLK